jgi:HSP20 family protein
MAIVRFDPFRGFAMVPGAAPVLNDGTWVPAVDIYETDKNELVIKAELPEMKREAIAVTVEQNTLTISGERTPGDDVPRDAFRRVERAYGKFSRRFALPRTVDASKVAAEYRDGVLTVRLPMREEAKPRTVPVAVAS